MTLASGLYDLGEDQAFGPTVYPIDPCKPMRLFTTEPVLSLNKTSSLAIAVNMRDPFFPPPKILVQAVEPIAEYLSLPTLPLHIHEVLIAAACYQFIFSTISPAASTWLLPSAYPQLPTRTRKNWDIHVTSFAQSSFITALALYVVWNDSERWEMDWRGRIWGYTGAGGAVQGLAAGYFLWDLFACVLHFDVQGVGALVHAISALLVTSLGFRPFANYYGLSFILYEISTPFLNIHWFFDKLKMTGSRLQLYNGIALLVTFFGGRVLWGNYQSIRIYSDVWTALNSNDVDAQLVSGKSIFAFQNVRSSLGAGDRPVDLILPVWLAYAYLAANTVLNVLNIYWFSKMIQALRKRFQPQAAAPKKFERFENGKVTHVD